MSALLKENDIQALHRTVADLLSAIAEIRDILQKFDALPPPESERQRLTRSWFRDAIVRIQTGVLLPPVTIYAIVKALDTDDSIH